MDKTCCLAGHLARTSYSHGCRELISCDDCSPLSKRHRAQIREEIDPLRLPRISGLIRAACGAAKRSLASSATLAVCDWPGSSGRGEWALPTLPSLSGLSGARQTLRGPQFSQCSASQLVQARAHLPSLLSRGLYHSCNLRSQYTYITDLQYVLLFQLMPQAGFRGSASSSSPPSRLFSLVQPAAQHHQHHHSIIRFTRSKACLLPLA